LKEQKAVKSKNKKKAAIQKKVNKNKTKISEIALETGAFEDAQPEAPVEEDEKPKKATKAKVDMAALMKTAIKHNSAPKKGKAKAKVAPKAKAPAKKKAPAKPKLDQETEDKVNQQYQEELRESGIKPPSDIAEAIADD
jgi:hypothetical protein